MNPIYLTESTGQSDRLGLVDSAFNLSWCNKSASLYSIGSKLYFYEMILLQNIGRISEEQTDINPMKCQIIWYYVDLQNKTCLSF